MSYNHNDLKNIQGGADTGGTGVADVTDFYHLTAAEYDAVQSGFTAASGISGYSGYSGIGTSGYSGISTKGAGSVTLAAATSTYQATGVTMAADDVVILSPASAAAAAALAADAASGIYVSAINGASGFTATHPGGYSGTVFSYLVTGKNP